ALHITARTGPPPQASKAARAIAAVGRRSCADTSDLARIPASLMREARGRALRAQCIANSIRLSTCKMIEPQGWRANVTDNTRTAGGRPRRPGRRGPADRLRPAA